MNFTHFTALCTCHVTQNTHDTPIYLPQIHYPFLWAYVTGPICQPPNNLELLFTSENIREDCILKWYLPSVFDGDMQESLLNVGS